MISSFNLMAIGAVALGGVLRGVTGFGGALVMSPLFSMIYGPAEGVALTIMVELAGYLILLPAASRHIRWKDIGPMSLTATAVLPLGAWLVVSVNPAIMRRVIGAVVMLLSALLLAGKSGKRRPPLAAALGVSALSGLLEGLAGTPGPPVVLYLYSGPDSAASNRHNLVGYFSLLDTLAMGVFILGGVITTETFSRLPLLVVAALGSTWLGGMFFTRFSEKLLRKLGLVLILLIGAFGLFG